MEFGFTLPREGVAEHPDPLKLLTDSAHAAADMGCDYLVMGDRLESGLDTLSMFAALIYGAPFGYESWAASAGWAAIGNIIGGIGLVTALRILQAGKQVVKEQRAAAGA